MLYLHFCPPSSQFPSPEVTNFIRETIYAGDFHGVWCMYDPFLGELTKVSVFQNLGRTTLSLKDHPLILITTLS